MKLAITLLLCAGIGMSAAAQPVYRCGNAYSDTPCPSGRPVDVNDSRTESQRGDAQRLAALDARHADQMARERLAAQAAQERRLAKATQPKATKRTRVTPIRWART